MEPLPYYKSFGEINGSELSSFFLLGVEYWKDGIPLWEKKFCKEIGRVPWGKIVDSKNFISCHPNIVNWDDSACEEAFHSAKRRYWAEINRHQCDIFLPDPDKYIESIDWSPVIDSKMIEELDWAYCTPNKTQNDDWLECKNKRTRNSSSVRTEGDDIEDPGHEGSPWKHSNQLNENPGERSNQLNENAGEHSNQLIENAGQGWSQWNLSDSGKANNDGNPWDSVSSTVNKGGMVDSAWRDKAHEVAVASWKKEGFASDARGTVDSAWRDTLLEDGVTSWNTKGFASDARGMVGNAWRDKVHQDGTDSWKAKGLASNARNNTSSRHRQSACNFDHYIRPGNDSFNRPGNDSYNRNARNFTDRIQPNIQGNERDREYRYRYGKRPKEGEFVRW